RMPVNIYRTSALDGVKREQTGEKPNGNQTAKSAVEQQPANSEYCGFASRTHGGHGSPIAEEMKIQESWRGRSRNQRRTTTNHTNYTNEKTAGDAGCQVWLFLPCIPCVPWTSFKQTKSLTQRRKDAKHFHDPKSAVGDRRAIAFVIFASFAPLRETSF